MPSVAAYIIVNVNFCIDPCTTFWENFYCTKYVKYSRKFHYENVKFIIFNNTYIITHYKYTLE